MMHTIFSVDDLHLLPPGKLKSIIILPNIEESTLVKVYTLIVGAVHEVMRYCIATFLNDHFKKKI